MKPISKIFLNGLAFLMVVVLSFALWSFKLDNHKAPPVQIVSCSFLPSKISTYISSISQVNYCAPRPTFRSVIQVTFSVDYEVDSRGKVDSDAFIEQLRDAMTSASQLSGGCTSLVSINNLSCTPGYHTADITLEYCTYCDNE